MSGKISIGQGWYKWTVGRPIVLIGGEGGFWFSVGVLWPSPGCADPSRWRGRGVWFSAFAGHFRWRVVVQIGLIGGEGGAFVFLSAGVLCPSPAAPTPPAGAGGEFGFPASPIPYVGAWLSDRSDCCRGWCFCFFECWVLCPSPAAPTPPAIAGGEFGGLLP